MTDNPDVEPGVVAELEPGLRRVLAPNPSPMTLHGTNTFLIGTDRVAVIDPGPNDASHLSALLGAIGDAKVDAILVTHSHIDHSPLARPLADATGAPIMAFGDSLAGRAEHMSRLAEKGAVGGGEGVDPDFAPDVILSDEEELDLGGTRLVALWTPGHMANHMCFDMEGTVFTGDHVMGWASSLVSPPDGDLTAFMASCERLLSRNSRIYHSAHGAPITAPQERVRWLIDHRKSRDAQILDALRLGPSTAADLARRIYTDIQPALMPAAERNVFAHLIDQHVRGLVSVEGELAFNGVFTLR